MPTVPTQFVPQTGSQAGGDIGQYQAPSVMPVDNFAARQTVELGRATTEAGMAAFRLASAVVDDIDEATTKRADIGALQGFANIDSQFRNLSGKAADDAYAGSVDQLTQVAKSQMDGLQNDTQRRMFEPIVSRNLETYRMRMMDHRNQQAKVYATNESAARGEQYADLAITQYRSRNQVDKDGYPVGPFQANLATALNEVRTAGKLMGFADDSAQMGMLEQKVYDRVAIGVVNSMLAEKQYGEADEFLTNETSLNRIDAKTADGLRSSVDSNRQRTTVDELVGSIKTQGILKAPSDPQTYNQEVGKKIEPPGTLREALVQAEQIKDPDMRRLVQNGLKVEFNQDEALAKQEYGIVIENIEQFLAVPGNTIAMLPADQFGRLKPVDRERYMRGQRQEDEVVVMEQLARNPSTLTSDWLERNRNKMTPSTFTKLLGDLNQPQKIIEATIDANQINKTFGDNDLMTLINPKTDQEKLQSINLRFAIEQAVTNRQTKLGKKLSTEERQPIIDEYVATWGRGISKGWIWDSTIVEDMPLAAMTMEQARKTNETFIRVGSTDVPMSEVARIRNQLRSVGMGEPTVYQIADYYKKESK